MRWFVLAMVAAIAVPARADDATSRAEARFQEGRALANAGNYQEACRAFEDSQRLDPASSTLINLGDCYAKLGLTASAWERYHRAMERAHEEKDEPRRKLAEERLTRVAVELSRLTIVSWAPAGVSLTRDGEPVPRSDLGRAVPVDPGLHRVVATVPGRPPLTLRVDVPEGATITVEVPISGRPYQRRPPRREDPRPTLAVVTGAAAVALVGIGSFYGLRARSRWHEAEGHCADGLCDARGVDLAGEARTAATASTVLFVAGTLSAGGAVFLWWTSRPEPSTTTATLAPLPGGGGIVVGGSFE